MFALRTLIALVTGLLVTLPRASHAQVVIDFLQAHNSTYTDSLQQVTFSICSPSTLRDTTAVITNSSGTTTLFLSDGPSPSCSGSVNYAFFVDVALRAGNNWIVVEVTDWTWTVHRDSINLIYLVNRAKVTAPGGGGVRVTPGASQVLPFVVTNVGPDTSTFTGVVRCTGPITLCKVAGGDSSVSVFLESGRSAAVDVTVTSTTGPGTGSVRVVLLGAYPDSATTPLISTAATAPRPTLVAGRDTIVVGTGQTGAQATFILSNPDHFISRSLTFGVTCPAQISCTAPSALALQPLQDSVVRVTVGTDTILGHYNLILKAFATSPADTVIDTVKVKVGKSSAPSLLVTLVSPDSGNSTARDQCLSIAAGASAAVECGALRVAYDFPGVRTMGRTRAPTLIYSSQHAHPYAAVALHVRRMNYDQYTGNIEVTATLISFPGLPAVSEVWKDTLPWSDACATNRGCLLNVPMDLLQENVQTGIYNYSINVRLLVMNAVQGSVTGRMAVVNDRQSPFGAGWWLEGLERLVAADTLGDKFLWIGGDGSTRLFTRQNDTLFKAAAPLVTRPEILVLTDSGYERRVTKAVMVRFDTLLRHIITQNASQHRTLFHYKNAVSTQLDSISVPQHSGGPLRAFRFLWAGIGDTIRLNTVRTRGVSSGTDREATVSLDSIRRLQWIRDAGGDTVKYQYSGSSRRMSARLDRLGAKTLYGYDPIGTVSSVGVIVGSDTLTTQICATEARSQVACVGDGAAATALSAGRWYTRVDGPRPDADAKDIARFYVGRFGAPDAIVDPLGRRTRLWREHSTLRGLVTRVVDVAGLQTTATYDSRGLITSSAVKGPFGDTTQIATSSFVWDTTWHAMKQITQPTGEVQNFGVNASDGLRTYEQLGADSVTRVRFTYTTSRLLSKVTVPGGIVTDTIIYGSNGNPSETRRALGARAVYTYNSDGSPSRLQLYATCDTSLTVHALCTDQKIVYNAMGRVTGDSTIASVLNYRVQNTAVEALVGTSPSLTAVVTTSYDKEGRPLSVHRITATTGYGAAAATSTWAYVAAGRTIKTSSGGAADSTVYDRGGNPVRIRTKRGHWITQTFDALGRMTSRTTPEVRYTAAYCPDCHGDSGPIPSDTVLVPEYSTLIGDSYYSRDVVIPTETAIFGYDAVGRMIQADNPLVRVRRGYYPNGALKADTSEMRLYSPGAGSGFGGVHRNTLSYEYDLSNRLRSRRDGFGGRQVFAYNGIGQLSSTTDSANTAAPTQVATISFTYDDRGQLASQTVGSVTESWTYDAEGQPIVRSGSMADSITYDNRGKRRRVIGAPLYGGSNEAFTAGYNGFGHVVASGFVGGAVYVEDEFTVDAFGNNLSRHRNRTAGFDELEQLETSVFSGEKLTSSAGVPRPGGRSGPGGVGPAVRAYEELAIVYDASGNVARQQSIRRVWDVVSGNGDIFVRGDAGHRWTWSFYDAAEKPRVVQHHQVVNDTVGDVTLMNEYWYDAVGRRVLARTYADTLGGCGNPPTTSPWPEVCQQSITRTTWDGDFLLREDRAPGAWNLAPNALEGGAGESAWYGRRRNTQAGAIDMPLVVWTSDGIGLAIVRNWRGNAAGAVQISGTTLGYEPVWPAAQVDIRHAPDARTSPPPGNSWWGSLVGAQKDATGLLYRRNRYYDPQTGRFTQEDPIGLAGGMNLYGYAGGDPINNSDPFGLYCIPCAVVVGTAIREGMKVVGAAIATTIVLKIKNAFRSESESAPASPAPSPERSLENPESLTGASETEVKGLVPEGWVESDSRSGGGTRYTDPRTRGADQVRTMPGDPNDSNPVKRGPYVHVTRHGVAHPNPVPLQGNPTLP